MNLFRFTEKQKKTLGFGVITLAWLMGIFWVITHYVQQPDVNTGSSLKKLSKADMKLEEQEEIIVEMNELYHEISQTRFEIYQDYYFEELLSRTKEISEGKSDSPRYRKQGGEVLKLLLFARQELRKQEGNLIKIGEDLQNCRDGKGEGAKPA